MSSFVPDYRNIVDAAYNREAKRLPLYEHTICVEIMETLLGKPFAGLYETDKPEFFRNYAAFYKQMGYDTVSFENCIAAIMPGSGALGGHVDPVIKTMDDFRVYPWKDIPDMYFAAYAKDFEALRDAMPEGMKGVGGVGNGVFECAQDLTGFENLCYIAVDDPELYAMLFAAIGDVIHEIWSRFIARFGDIYCVLRMGDDLGFKSSTILDVRDIKAHIIPQYKRVTALAHGAGKPFLYHSCGAIWDVMDDLISVAGINAKHSNEDQIAMFNVWVERYGDRIGNFGGIDTDAVCRLAPQSIHDYVYDMIPRCTGRGGFAFSTGNSIPNYVPVEGYVAMVEAVRQYRGE